MLRILFTGGGTGGHIYPLLAVAEELQKSEMDIDARYFGAPGDYKKNLEAAGITVSKIIPAKLRRYFDLRNFIDILILLPLSFIQAMWKVFWFMPDVLFSKGGPGALPVVLACRFYRVPVLIHDSDSIMGLTNRISSRFSQRIAVSFSSTVDELAAKNKKFANIIALTGNPIRPSLLKNQPAQAEAKKHFGFEPTRPVILVIGGSQGAMKINNFMVEMADAFMGFISGAEGPLPKWQILHQTGNKNFDGAKKTLDFILKNRAEGERSAYKLVPYFENDMKEAYLAADVVVSRSGSASIFEIAAFGKPSILVPLPQEVVGEHQVKNAYEYARTGAAVVIEEPNLKQNLFMAQLEKLFSEPGKLEVMSQAAKQFAKPQAAQLIAEEIFKIAERG